MSYEKQNVREMSESSSETQNAQKISSPKLERKLTALEAKAIELEKQFDGILKRTAEIETWVHQYDRKVHVNVCLSRDSC